MQRREITSERQTNKVEPFPGTTQHPSTSDLQWQMLLHLSGIIRGGNSPLIVGRPTRESHFSVLARQGGQVYVPWFEVVVGCHGLQVLQEVMVFKFCRRGVMDFKFSRGSCSVSSPDRVMFSKPKGRRTHSVCISVLLLVCFSWHSATIFFFSGNQGTAFSSILIVGWRRSKWPSVLLEWLKIRGFDWVSTNTLAPQVGLVFK